MSKKIKLFSTETERETYENVQSYQSISTTLSEDTDIVHYDSIFFKTGQQAQVGDIMLDNKLFVNPNYYDLFKNDYEVIGVVAIEKGFLPDKKGRVISHMFISEQEGGIPSTSPATQLSWGDNGSISGLDYYTQFPVINASESADLQLTIQRIGTQDAYYPSDNYTSKESLVPGYYYDGNYTSKKYAPCPYIEDGTLNPIFIATWAILPNQSTITIISNANADFDGKYNTKKILESSGSHLAAEKCVAYNVGSLDWYLPAYGEFVIAEAKSKKLLTSLKLVNSRHSGLRDCWSSTLNSNSTSWLGFSSGYQRYRSYKEDVVAMAQF